MRLLHAQPAGNTSHFGRGGRRLRRPLLVLVLEGSKADGADAGRGQLVGDLGEGLRIDVFPVGDLAVEQLRGPPVGRDGGGLRVGLSCAGVLLGLTGTVGAESG